MQQCSGRCPSEEGRWLLGNECGRPSSSPTAAWPTCASHHRDCRHGVFVGLQLSSTQVGLCHPLKPYRMAGPRSHACARACTHAHADPAAGAEGLEGMVAAAGDEGTRGGGGAGVVGPAPASRVYPTEIPGVGRRRKPRRGQEVRGGHSA